MDAKIITGLLLCFFFMASVLISQSTSARLDSRLRYRRQNGDTDADSTANDVESAVTTASSGTGAAETATAILADGTTIVLPPGTTATLVAEDTTKVDGAATGTAEPAAEGTTVGAATAEAATTEAATAEAATAEAAAAEATTGADEAGATATVADGGLETSTAITVDNDADVVTSAKPGNGHGTHEDDASNDTAATTNETATVEGTTVDTDVTTSADHEASTESSHVTGSDGILTTIDATDENATQVVPPGEPVAPSPDQPDSGGRVELRVVVNPEVLQVQRGRTVELNCIVYGGDATTTIYWIQEEPERRYALTDSPSENDKQVSASQVTLRARITLDDPSKIGKYTCTAHDSAGNSGSAILTMQEGGGYYPQQPVYPQEPVYPGVVPGPSGGRGYLRIVAPDMAEGDYVEIQCEGAAPEDEGNIQWYFNNRLLNDEQPLYPRGKTLHIRPISRPYLGNYRCSIPGSGYTDANSVLTFEGAGPVVPVVPTQPPYYPPYQPASVGCRADEATCNNRRCIPRAYVCDGKDDCGDNSDETCSRPGGSGSGACQPNEIGCSDPNRGRKCVQKFWMCDGDRDCDDGSDEQQRYCELLPRQRYCQTSEFQCTGVNGTYGNPVCIPRSFQCDGYNDCPDRSDELGCVKPTVISPPQRQIQINAGETLTIQCTARGAPAPYINWRLNWGHICGDGYDNGRCTMAQALDSNDPTVVTGTLTIRNVNANDGGAYSCEALNNQGFIFAIPDAIVNVIIGTRLPPPTAPPCSCNGHSSYCTPDGRCENCQHNTAGHHCEYCAPGYQGDARRGTPYDCQLIPVSVQRCDPSGTHTERVGRCICKYNVEGDRCDQCKRSHFYLNPITPNGCLACFCSGVSSDCTSTDWRRHAISLPLNNWNAVPKNFATDLYEAGSRIQQRQGGREIALDQSSLGRGANEVLYWKAPREVLGDVVTLYDGNIDIHFTNDGNDNEAPSNDEYIWLRGNNIDLVHKFPQTQRFKANTNATYSVPINERTFTRKDGTYIDRENILMALSDLDTLLIKINPIGGRRNAVLRGVTLNVAARDGYADAAPTVEACSCPANYTGTSCEKCAEGYGRPHPLVGIYLGQCWSCRSVCHERSDQCDRETGKCSNCQGNSEGDRCERCRAGYTLDGRTNQCVRGDQYPSYPSEPSYEPVTRTYYVNQQPYDSRSGAPLTVHLDGNQPEQRIPLQLGNFRPNSLVWGRTDGSPLPPNVVQEGNDLVFRNPSADQAGNYICTITHPDGSIDRVPVYVDYRPGQYGYVPQPTAPPHTHVGAPRVVIQPRIINLKEGQRMIVQYSVGSQDPVEVNWNKLTDQGYQPIPSLFTVETNRLVLQRATPDAAGTYQVVVRNRHGEDRQDLVIKVEPRRGRQRGQQPSASQNQQQQSQQQGYYGLDQDRSRSYIDVRLTSRDEQSHQVGREIYLQCAVYGSVERPYEFTFTKDGRSLENNVEVHPDGVLIIRNAQANDAGQYRCEVNFPRAPEVGTQGSTYDLRIEGGSAAYYDQNYQRGGDYSQQGGYVEVTVEPTEVTIGRGEKATITCHVKGANDYKVTWGKYSHETSLPNYARQEGNSVIIAPTIDSPAEQMYLQCQVDVQGETQPRHAYAPVNIRGDESSKKKKKRRS